MGGDPIFGFMDAIFILSPDDFFEVVEIEKEFRQAVLLYMQQNEVRTPWEFMRHYRRICEMLNADMDKIDLPDLDV
jgi:hypothetical protein